ncbi:MAG: SDR family NAD(P)-dependent oxidoreductase [Candidatus Methanoperedens sp.]
MTKVLITGCAGFIGSHLTEYFLKEGSKVIGIDDLSRKGSKSNLKFLLETKNFEFYEQDIRDFENIIKIFKKSGPFDLIIHEAAQVAVTTSVINPREDFEINALGTFNLLEATRLYSPDAFFEFASTNKVYGKMSNIKIVQKNARYEYSDSSFGIDEGYPLDFYSPYGCSKGAADQYVRDYNRIYGLKTVVLRQSCIYGTKQFGIEDQGWIAWFTIASLLEKPLTIYGDGKQIRDVLWIDDLIDAYVKMFHNADRIAGEIFNIGGGRENTLSLIELVDILKQEGILKIEPVYSNWRPGDQKVFVCNINKAYEAVGWKPTTTPRTGVKKLIDWAFDNKNLLKKFVG